MNERTFICYRQEDLIMKLIIDRNSKIINGELFFDSEEVIENCESFIIGKYHTDGRNYILYRKKGDQRLFATEVIEFDAWKDHVEIHEEDD